VIDELRAAAEALNRGDPEPFAALFADDAEWRGVEHGRLWWKDRPVCHGREEAAQVLRVQIAKRAELARSGGDALRVLPEFTRVGDDRIIGASEWADPDGTTHRRFQVLTFRDGKIVDLQGCRTRREAERFARRRDTRGPG
jgi:ketosteroid isomerase-like protein